MRKFWKNVNARFKIGLVITLIFLVIGGRNTRYIQQTRKFVEHGKYLQKIMSPEALTLTGL